jgi:pimeloyl-ACP methyl ester carboxylesterase
MTRNRVVRSVAILAALAVSAVCVSTFFTYRRDIRRAHERIATGSKILDTPCGPLEYAIAGDDGPAVLAVHGAGGGFDQGLDVTDALVHRGYRVVAVSRFGYLRTALPADASPAAQADAYACLLDALHIQHVVVVGASAGGPSSMQFALRHPERVNALVLLVPLAYPTRTEQRASAATIWAFDVSLRSDFLFWLATRIAHRAVMRAVLGTPPAVIEQASADDRARVARIGEHILPVSPRRLGLLNDAAIGSTLRRYDLEQIRTPTLIVSARDDGYGTYDGARYSAEHIPGARFVGFVSGGHLLVGHQEEVTAEIEKFLK